MRVAAIASAIAFLAFATPAAAQFRTVQKPPDTWVTGWIGGYMSPDRVMDGASGRWDFGSTFAGGLGLHRRIGQSLSLGLETSFAPASYELSDDEGTLLDSGNARLVTAMLSGRLRTGGGGPLGMYVTGGAGAFIYGMSDLDRWDPDLALYTGAGLEYQPSVNKALFLEWGRYWTFHQKEGIRDNSARHSQLRAGVRIGF